MKKTISIFAFFLLLSSVHAQTSAGYGIGDQATDFRLKSVDGEFYSMSDYADAKGFIVIFTCNTCPYVVRYEDRINNIALKYKEDGYILLAINPNDPIKSPGDSYEAMQIRAKEKDFVFPYLFDDGQEIYPQYGATRTPHVFLLDKHRVVKYIGTIDDNYADASKVKENYLENAIAAMKLGETPDPGTTKAIGCGIKAKDK